LIAVAVESHTHEDIKSLDDLDRTLLQEIEHFFFSYNQERGKKFETIGRRGPKRARSLVQKQTRKSKRGCKAKSK
jgi:inorganic pyrophosphatase